MVDRDNDLDQWGVLGLDHMLGEYQPGTPTMKAEIVEILKCLSVINSGLGKMQ